PRRAGACGSSLRRSTGRSRTGAAPPGSRREEYSLRAVPCDPPLVPALDEEALRQDLAAALPHLEDPFAGHHLLARRAVEAPAHQYRFADGRATHSLVGRPGAAHVDIGHAGRWEAV